MRKLAVLCALCLLALPGGALAKGQAHPNAPTDMAKAMETWQSLIVPGPQHEYLDRFVGEYDTVTRMWMQGPDAPPMESPGAASVAWALGGRYLEQRATGNLMGQPMEGIGYTGYDRFRKQYFMVWFDNFNTAPLTAQGMFDPSGESLELYGVMDEPMLDAVAKNVKYVMRFTDEGGIHFEIHDLSLGENSKAVEVDYTRRK